MLMRPLFDVVCLVAVQMCVGVGGWIVGVGICRLGKTSASVGHILTAVCLAFFSFYVPFAHGKGGALRFAPVCLSVRPFVTIYGIEFYNQLLLQFSIYLFFKPCLLVVDTMEMCMWVFDDAKINFDSQDTESEKNATLMPRPFERNFFPNLTSTTFLALR